jgi:hypothetical protein
MSPARKSTPIETTSVQKEVIKDVIKYFEPKLKKLRKDLLIGTLIAFLGVAPVIVFAVRTVIDFVRPKIRIDLTLKVENSDWENMKDLFDEKENDTVEILTSTKAFFIPQSISKDKHIEYTDIDFESLKNCDIEFVLRNGNIRKTLLKTKIGSKPEVIFYCLKP